MAWLQLNRRGRGQQTCNLNRIRNRIRIHIRNRIRIHIRNRILNLNRNRILIRIRIRKRDYSPGVTLTLALINCVLDIVITSHATIAVIPGCTRCVGSMGPDPDGADLPSGVGSGLVVGAEARNRIFSAGPGCIGWKGRASQEVRVRVRVRVRVKN